MRNFLRIFAIIYLGWAIIYSILILPSWLPKVIAFKNNGGLEVAWQFQKVGLNIKGINVLVKDKRLSFVVLEPPDPPPLPQAEITYFWNSNTKLALNDYLIKNKKQFSDIPKKDMLTKTSKDFAILAIKHTDSGQNFENLDRTTTNLKHPKQSWHPFTEINFFSTVKTFETNLFAFLRPIVENSPFFLAILQIISLGLFGIVTYINIFISAFTPTPLLYITIFIPILIYFFMARFLIKNLKKSGD